MSTITLNIPSDRSGSVVVNNAFTFTIDFDDTAISPELRHLLTTDPYVPAPVDPALERLLAEEEAIRTANTSTAERARANADHMSRLNADPDNNRQVHAFDRYVEVVRYDRQGKWYLETRTDPAVRTKLSIAEAVEQALTCQLNCGIIRTELHGGSTFDRKVRQALTT